MTRALSRTGASLTLPRAIVRALMKKKKGLRVLSLWARKHQNIAAPAIM